MSEQLHHLSIDLETYSEVNIGKAGAYRYILDPSFEILLFAYSLDGMPVEVIDVASGQVIPLWLKNALKNPLYIKHAYNAAFEWFALSKYLGWLPPDQWRDTMLHALYCGYPASLDAAGRAMGLPEDKKKLTTGKALIRYFCVPCKPSNANGNPLAIFLGTTPPNGRCSKSTTGRMSSPKWRLTAACRRSPCPPLCKSNGKPT